MARIELCRLPFSFQSSNVKISAVLGAVRLEAIYFLRSHFGKLSECSRMDDLQTRFTRVAFQALSRKLTKLPFLFYANQN